MRIAHVARLAVHIASALTNLVTKSAGALPRSLWPGSLPAPERIVSCLRDQTNLADVYVGQRIMRTRLFRSVSVNEFAKHLNISPQQLAVYESGEARIPADTLLRISDLLNVRWQFFFDRKSDETSGLVALSNLTPCLPANDDDLLHVTRH